MCMHTREALRLTGCLYDQDLATTPWIFATPSYTFCSYSSPETPRFMKMDHTPLIRWLSRVDMQKRHQDFQLKQIGTVGHWCLESTVFRSWRDNDGRGLGTPLSFLTEDGEGKSMVRCINSATAR